MQIPFQEWPEPLRVARDGIDIAYWTFGEGAPLTLITGLATPAKSWGPLPTFLAGEGFRVIVADNRDAGESSKCEGMTYTIKDMADDTVAIWDELSVERSNVLGISMGGMIAQEVALSHSSRVERLLLMSTDPGPPERVAESKFWEEFVALSMGSQDEYFRALLALITAPGFAESNPETIEWLVKVRSAHAVDGNALGRQLNATMGFSSAQRLRDLKIPVLVMHGTLDRMIPYPNGKFLSENIPGAEFITIEGAGHLLPIEATAQVASAITEFFSVSERASASA